MSNVLAIPAHQPVKLKLTGIGRDPFHLLSAFVLAARDQGWSDEAITIVLRRAMAGDRRHMRRTIREYISDVG